MKISGNTLFSSKSKAAGLALFLLLAVAPLLLGLVYALLYSFGIAGLVSEGPTLHYWQLALSDTEFWVSLGYTLYISLSTIALTIVAALGLVLFLKRPLQQGLPGFSLYVPLAFPAIVVAFLVFQLASRSGLLSRIFYSLGLIQSTAAFPELVNDPYAIGIIAAHTFMAVPFFTLYFMNLYDNERIGEFSNVARTLGAGRARRMFHIQIPILLRRAFPTLTLYTIFVMGSYEIPLILGRQSPQMMSVLIIRKLREYSLATIPEAYIAALLYSVIVVVLLVLIFKTHSFSYDLDH